MKNRHIVGGIWTLWVEGSVLEEEEEDSLVLSVVRKWQPTGV